MEGLGGLNASFEMIGQFGFDDVIIRKYPMLDHINHVHTPGNSSGIVDGSSAVLIGSEKAGKDLGLTPRGAYRGHGGAEPRTRSSCSRDPGRRRKSAWRRPA
jgi:acetyl-CoA acetyltransferase